MNTTRAFVAVGALANREFKRFVRQRSRLVGAILTPLLFWILLGFGIDSSSGGGTSSSGIGGAANFKQYFVPGMMVMGILFTAIYSAISLIEDRNSGFLQGVIVSPLPKWSMLLSKILGASIIVLFQGVLLLPIAYLAGLHPGVLDFFASLVIFFVIGLFISSLSLHFGWRIESVAGFHQIMNTVLMPLWFLSGAPFPIQHGPLFLVARINPLTYAVTAFQDLLFHSDYSHYLLGIGVMVGVSLILFAINLGRRTSL